MNYSSTKIILLFFLSAVIVGTLVLSLPFTRQGSGGSVLTNMFTVASAVCVTGLSVVDIGTYYSFWGQIVILVFIQLGGLGYMTLSTVFGLFIGKVTLKERAVLREVLDVTSFSGLLQLLKRIVIIVFSIEAVGAAVLTAVFSGHMPFLKALYFGIFHSVSSFCNAGLSLFPENLAGYSGSWPVLMTVTLLVVVGGIGFLVLVELGSKLVARDSRFSLHTKIVLCSTAALIVLGASAFWLLEKDGVLAGGNVGHGLANSVFQSVTARTAGFNTVAIDSCNKATALLLSGFMFIGASPGGTGGGIKTTTFILVLLFIVAGLRDRENIRVFRRQVPSELVRKSLLIFILSIFFIGFVTMILVEIENAQILDLFFETVSAFGTVGFSRGVTSSLSDAGRITIIFTMILGRIGPLAFLLALMKKAEETYIKYPEEKILVG